MHSRKLFGLADQNAEIDLSKVSNRKQLLELASSLQDALVSPRRDLSNWSYLANSDMSGLPVMCSQFTCRQRKVSDTAAFAALYADQVVMVDPFSALLPDGMTFLDVPLDEPNEKWFYEVMFAMVAHQALLPLVEAGICTFAPFEGQNLCQECFDKLFAEGVNDREKVGAIGHSYLELLNSSTIALESRDEGEVVLTVEGAAADPDHGQSLFVLRNVPEVKLFDGLEENDQVPRELVHKAGVFMDKARFASADLVSSTTTAVNLGIGAVSANVNEVAVLKMAFGADFIERSFSFDMPYLFSDNLTECINLRSKYSYEFGELRKVFEELNLNSSQAPYEISKKVQIEVASEIDRIDKLIRDHRSKAWGDFLESSAIASVGLGAALMTSGVSGIMAATAGILGGGHFAKSSIPALRNVVSQPDAVKDSQLYFAWKAKKALKQ